MQLKSVYSLKDKYEDLENKIKFDIGDIIIKDNYLYLVSEIIVLQKFELGLEINYKICCSNDPNFKSVLYNFEYVNENF